jgi:site-specific recombinase XerD
MIQSNTQKLSNKNFSQETYGTFLNPLNHTGSNNHRTNLIQNNLIIKQNYKQKGGHYSIGKNQLIRILMKLRRMKIMGKQHIERYLRDQYRRNLTLSTIRQTSPIIFPFLQLAQQKGKNCLEELSRTDIGAFIEQEQDRGLKPATVKLKLDILKAFVRYQIEKGTIPADVLAKRIIIKVPDALPKAMEIEDEAKLLSVIKHTRNRAMILLLLRTGMRIGELLNTQVQDIHLTKNKIDIWESQKTRIGRVVYFSEDAADALKAWLKQRDQQKPFVFYACKRDTLTYAGARIMFCKYLEKANLSHKSYTLHCLRHTNASSLLNAGISLECLRELLGHNSVEVTRRYARLTNTTREKEYFKAMNKIEKGEINGYYKLDPELQEILKKKKLFTHDSEKLYEQP